MRYRTAHYKECLKGAHTAYTIRDDDQHVYASGTLSRSDIEIGKNRELGRVTFPLAQFDHPVKLVLEVSTYAPGYCHPAADSAADSSHIIRNHWDFWVYPAHVDMPSAQDICVTDTLDARAVKTLEKGGKVLLLAAGKVKMGEDVKQYYLPVFWNTSWFKMRPPHTTGAYIDNSHPLFRRFPSDDWANLNWWELLNKAQVMNLREFPFDYQPVIQPIDTWHVSRKLGMLVEANVLKGRLLITTMDLDSQLDRRLVARQMRKAILDYMESEDFRPTIRLDVQTVNDLYTKSAPAVNMFTNDSPDELKPKLK